MDSGHYKLLLTGVILVQIVGFVVLWMKIPAATSNATRVVSTVPVIDPNSVKFATKIPQNRILRQAIDSVLKQELAPYLTQLAAAQRVRLKQTQVEATAMPRPGGPANIQAARQSSEIVDRALASGVWTDSDSSALLRVAPLLSENQRVGLLDKIFGAINNQELKPVGSLPSL